MTEIENNTPKIERNRPRGTTHPVARQEMLDIAGESMGSKQEILSLATYLKDIAGKPRGVEGGSNDLNSHFEEFIVRDGSDISVVSLENLQKRLRELEIPVEILGVEAMGNPNQRVKSAVQGINRENPKSGYERPTVAEGPHMILAPYAVDKDGKIHVFRTVQFRTGEAVIDTPRGFADAKSLESGQEMYEVENAGGRVRANLTRIVGEEAGEQLLKIRKIVFLGAPRVNSSFVTSRSALFAVEVDYDHFIRSNKVVSDQEFERRREQFEHEGLTGIVLDMDLDQYVNFKRDSEISRDLAADSASDIVVLDFLATKLQSAHEVSAERRVALKKFGEVFKKLKQQDPQSYKKAWTEVVSALNIKS